MASVTTVQIPVPSIPSGLTEVEVAATPRRGVPEALLVAPVAAGADAEPPDSSRDRSDGRAPVRSIHGSDIPEEWLPAGRVSGRPGEVHAVRAVPGGPRWLVGIGAGSDGEAAEPKSWRTAGASLIRAANSHLEARHDAGERVSRTLQLFLPGAVPTDRIAALVLGVRLGGYRFSVSAGPRPPVLRTVRMVVSGERLAEVRAAVERASELAAATALARDLANTPSNVKNPVWLAETATRIAAGVPGLRADVRDTDWLSDQRFGGLLAVGGGSVSPPRLIEMSYRPRGARKHLLLVGKGITFDTGGISIKPAAGMHLMRTDMSGGAAVIAAMRAIAALKIDVRVTALVPAAENHVSGSAYRPGDVLRHYGGRTSEIGNTDAEGRIVLADALAYGVRRFSPDVVVDVATLTGAMKVALGLRTGGLFATSDQLANRLGEAGARVGEAWWPMPLLDVHADAVRSEIADLKQTPSGPGGITAALFLREFTDGVPWAHLDIAGPARAEGTYDEVVPGGTGFAARTLVEFAASYASPSS